jgi:hypothetical protein
MAAIHREKVVISRYDGRHVTDGRLIEKDRAKVEGSLKRLMKFWRLPIGTDASSGPPRRDQHSYTQKAAYCTGTG